MWTVNWTQRALDDLASLDTQIARRVIAKVEAAKANPPRFFDRLTGADAWRMRVGDLRIIALLAFDVEVVTIQSLDKRSRVYR